MFLSSHPISVDGVRLDTYAWGLQSSSMRLGALRSADTVLAGIDGYQPSLADSREPSTLTLSMLLKGTDEDGLVVPGQDGYLTVRNNLDHLMHTVAKSGVLLDVRETVDNVAGTQRQFYGKVLEALEPSLEVGNVARLTVVLDNPGVYWRDVATTDWTQAAIVSGTDYEVTALAGSSGPIEDAVILVTGPTTGGVTTVTDPATGYFVRLNESIPAGSAWRINCATWESRVGVGLTLASADTAGTDKAGVTDQGGAYLGRLLRLNPRLVGGTRRVKLRVTATGMTAASALSTRTRKAYL